MIKNEEELQKKEKKESWSENIKKKARKGKKLIELRYEDRLGRKM